MPEFKQGKIYCIRSHQCQEVYVGSTTETLSRRMSAHRCMFKRYNDGKGNYLTAFELMKYSDCYIELIEYFSCNTRAELNAREGKWIRETDCCVNKRIEGRTRTEYLLDNKEATRKQKAKYYADSREQILDKRKEFKRQNPQYVQDRDANYRKNNREKLSVKKQEYYQENRDDILDKGKKRYQENRDTILDRNAERVLCNCGVEIRRAYMTRHKKTISHRQAMFNLHNILNHL